MKPPIQYLFFRQGWRRGSCNLCHALVAKGSVLAHARWHWGRGEHGDQPVRRDWWGAFRIVLVGSDGRPYSPSGGWVTNNPGPQ